MKRFLLTLLVGISGSASSAFGVAPVYGTLTEVSQSDSVASFRCQSNSGKGYTIALSHDSASRTLALELGGMLAYPEDSTMKIKGHYVEIEAIEANKPVLKSHELKVRGYHINLAYTEGKPLPVLTLAYGARPFICQ